MSPIFGVLKEMRGRLGMYLGDSSIIRLAAFLRGYDFAIEKSGGMADPFLPMFRDWVHQRFQSSQRSWEETILQHSADEADAVKRFWGLLDDFLKEYPKSEPFEANGSEDSDLETAEKTKPQR